MRPAINPGRASDSGTGTRWIHGQSLYASPGIRSSRCRRCPTAHSRYAQAHHNRPRRVAAYLDFVRSL